MKLPDDEDKERQRKLRQAGIYMTIPFVLAGPPIVGLLIGGWLDGFFGTAPWLMYSLIVLGFIAGFRDLYDIIKRFGDGG